jgi:hypothetical protein
VDVGRGQFGNSGTGTSAVGTWYQRTGEGQKTKRTQRVSSELQADCVWNRDSSIDYNCDLAITP